MATLLYIHGFLSSPLSHKARAVAHWLSRYRSDITYCCPALTPYPDEVQQVLCNAVETAANNGPVYLMGSSMGGFWATYLAQTYQLPAVLINPAVDVANLFPHYLNRELKNYHTDESYRLQPEHLEALMRYECPAISEHHRYWLLVQSADETLDYRLAVNKYKGCRQRIEQGGDHSFQHFENHIPAAIEFLDNAGRV